MTGTEIRAAAPADARAIAAALRAADRREILAGRADGDVVAAAVDCVRLSGLAWTACRDGAPVAAWGAAEARAGLWQVWMFATDVWPRVAVAVTRHALRVVVPALLARGANRAECRSIAGHDAAHRWLARLGAVREAALPDYGTGRETFILFAWRRRDFERCA